MLSGSLFLLSSFPFWGLACRTLEGEPGQACAGRTGQDSVWGGGVKCVCVGEWASLCDTGLPKSFEECLGILIRRDQKTARD